MPTITVSLPDGQKLTHELTDEVTTIGRVEDNVLQIPDGSVSSHHAEIVLVDGKYHVKDLNSTNGTIVNGRTIVENVLNHSDRVQFGDIHAIFQTEESGEKIALPTGAEPQAVLATSSALPSDFANAAPFPKKSKKKDPVAQAILALAIIALLAGLGIIFYISQLRAPIL